MFGLLASKMDNSFENGATSPNGNVSEDSNKHQDKPRGAMKHREAGSALELSFVHRVPDGDSVARDICGHCGLIHYDNPKIVVGSVVTFEKKFLLCKRAIEPRRGFWTLPAGFMEHGESVEEGACREAREEANVEIHIRDVLAIYSIPRIAQVQIMYRAELKTPKFSPGVESLEVALFGWNDIPWDELAFPSVHWALRQFQQVADKAVITPFTNPEGALG